MSVNVLEEIRKVLIHSGVPFREMHHEATLTSADSSRVRGDPLAQGAKALVLKCGDKFGLFVLSAATSVDAGAIKRELKVKKVRFATPEELLELTGLLPGSVPPFGRPVLDLNLYVDRVLTHQPVVSFNAGSLTDSMTMATSDYLVTSEGYVFGFSR